MYKNMICFFFYSIIQNVWIVSKEESKTAERHTPGPCYESSVNPFFLSSVVGSNYSWLYNITDALANFRGHTFTNLPRTQCTWIRFFLACNPCNLRSTSAENTCVQFTLGTRYVSCYFVQPWFDFRRCINMSNRFGLVGWLGFMAYQPL